MGDIIAVDIISAKENKPFLPDLDREESQNKAREANEKILVELGKKRPSSHYHHGHEPCAKIRRFATSSGNKAAVDKYSKEADHQLKALFVA